MGLLSGFATITGERRLPFPQSGGGGRPDTFSFQKRETNWEMIRTENNNSIHIVRLNVYCYRSSICLRHIFFFPTNCQNTVEELKGEADGSTHVGKVEKPDCLRGKNLSLELTHHSNPQPPSIPPFLYPSIHSSIHLQGRNWFPFHHN